MLRMSSIVVSEVWQERAQVCCGGRLISSLESAAAGDEVFGAAGGVAEEKIGGDGASGVRSGVSRKQGEAVFSGPGEGGRCGRYFEAAAMDQELAVFGDELDGLAVVGVTAGEVGDLLVGEGLRPGVGRFISGFE